MSTIYKILFIFSVLLGANTQIANAQWVSERQIDAYPTHEQHLQALDKSLTILEKSDPLADLRSSLAKHDTRLVAYKNVGLVFPGVPRRQLKVALQKNGYKFLKGSTDVLTPELSERISRVATRYMALYNKTLLRNLSSRGKTPPKKN